MVITTAAVSGLFTGGALCSNILMTSFIFHVLNVDRCRYADIPMQSLTTPINDPFCRLHHVSATSVGRTTTLILGLTPSMVLPVIVLVAVALKCAGFELRIIWDKQTG